LSKAASRATKLAGMIDIGTDIKGDMSQVEVQETAPQNISPMTPTPVAASLPPEAAAVQGPLSAAEKLSRMKTARQQETPAIQANITHPNTHAVADPSVEERLHRELGHAAGEPEVHAERAKVNETPNAQTPQRLPTLVLVSDQRVD
jgi:hypothetical protein